jgi:NADPH-dependent 2,4-dienoyl-CoA reductase/sulfur reductase-like enzyme
VAELVVIGGGPAGMAAAVAAAGRGAQVSLVDSASRLGGQIYRQPLVDGEAPPTPAGPALPRRFRRLGDGSVELLLGWSVWSIVRRSSGFLLLLHPTAGELRGRTLEARAVVLATGASELVLPFPGWDLPGVSTAGCAQALLKSQDVPVGRRVIVAGSGPFLLPVAASIAESGAKVVAVVEASRSAAGLVTLPRGLRHPHKVIEALGYVRTLLRHRVPFLAGRAVVRCEGQGRVERASVARLDRDWLAIPGTERSFEVDAVCVSFDFVPRLELSRHLELTEVANTARPAVSPTHDRTMAASLSGVFVAGELTGIGGAQVAELEGHLAGSAAATYLGHAGEPSPFAAEHKVQRRLARSLSFARLMDVIYPLRPGWTSWPSEDTILCRCEDVTWGTVQRAITAGAATTWEVRGLTRCGMGYCQGRTCGPPLQLALAARTGAPLPSVGDLHSRPVATPVRLGDVARSFSQARSALEDGVQDTEGG